MMMVTISSTAKTNTETPEAKAMGRTPLPAVDCSVKRIIITNYTTVNMFV